MLVPLETGMNTLPSRRKQCHFSLTMSLLHLVVAKTKNTPLPQVFSTVDFFIDAHWTDLTESRLDHFLLIIGFVLVFSSRLSAVD